MRTILTALCLAAALAPAARAQTLSYGTISTATASGIIVSSQAVTRVDNLNLGVAAVIPNRNAIVLSVPASGKVNCGFDVLVSTIPPSLTVTSTHYGTEYTAGVYTIPCPSTMAYYCLSASASAAQAVSVQQVSPFKPGTRTIP